ncbi:MAG: hypothetical protein J0H43_07075 [Actinobacteria bacterium]|nr:hypothetical protein [Actinomycetota bacterium]
MVNVLVGIAVLVLLVVRQLQPRPAREDSSLRLMAILAIVGVVELGSAVKKAHEHAISASAVALLVAGLVIGAVFGAVRAMTVHIWRDESGAAWRRGTAVTAVLWVVSLGVHLLGDALLDHVSSVKGLGTSSILLYLAITLGVQREIVRMRAARITHGRPAIDWRNSR